MATATMDDDRLAAAAAAPTGPLGAAHPHSHECVRQPPACSRPLTPPAGATRPRPAADAAYPRAATRRASAGGTRPGGGGGGVGTTAVTDAADNADDGRSNERQGLTTPGWGVGDCRGSVDSGAPQVRALHIAGSYAVGQHWDAEGEWRPQRC